MQNFSKLAARLGLEVPIIQAPMANVSTPLLALAVSRAGGLGSLALSPFDLTKGFDPVFKEIAEFRRLRGKNSVVNCNFFCFDPKEQHAPTQEEVNNWAQLYEAATNVSAADILMKVGSFEGAVTSFKEFEKMYPKLCEQFIDRLINEKVGVVSFHFGAPSKATIERFQSGGILVFGCVTLVQEARNLTDLGVDVLVCQGYEAGGHRGNFLVESIWDENLTTYALFDQVKRFTETLSSPPLLVASGGIVEGKTILHYVNKGAAAVQLGTVFVPSTESRAPSHIAESIDEKKATTTIMTPLVSGRNARTLKTPFIHELTRLQFEKGYKLPLFGYATSAYRKFASGDKDYGFYLAGQNYHLVDTGLTAAEIIKKLRTEMQPHAGNE
ncbi:nitronate monooxygenase [Metschnikowia aff. pulcherrima]|uniref:Nitronate monooxygenase n=1 Tax=Metschnikowia aff. pulcherrima TaxID=2163413 RepID=A0A4P6XT87_9ASCO|nr:nitronate monooxygenase [Metschnikowia aff. pulcherrima]